MNRARLLLGLGVSALAALLVPFGVASCADTDNGSGGPAGGNPLPEGGEASLPDAGGCDAADPSCVSTPISCSDVYWCPVQTNVESLYALTKVWGAASNDVWAVGAGATVIHWDGGKWSKTPVPPAYPSPLDIHNTFLSIWGSGPNDVWIGSTTTTIYRNTGSGWVHQRLLMLGDQEVRDVPVQAIWSDGPNRVRIGTFEFLYELPGFLMTGNQLTTSTSGKLDWTPEEGTARVLGYYGTPDDLWLVGDNSHREQWQRAYVQQGLPKAGKVEWTQSEVYSLVSLHAIWGNSANDLWLVGDQGAMRHLAPGKNDWEVVPPVTKESLYAIWGTSATNIWVAGENGTILHYDGTTWTPEQAAFPAGKKKPNLTGIWGSGPDDIWIVGGHVALHYNGKKGGIVQ